MQDKIIHVGSAVLVRWEQLTEESVTRSDAFTLNAAKSTPGGKVHYFAVITPTLPIPDAKVRAHMSKNLPMLQAVCLSINVVVEGRGLKQAAIRSVAASFLLFGDRTMHVWGNLEDAVAHLGLGADILASARSSGIAPTPTLT